MTANAPEATDTIVAIAATRSERTIDATASTPSPNPGLISASPSRVRSQRSSVRMAATHTGGPPGWTGRGVTVCSSRVAHRPAKVNDGSRQARSTAVWSE